MMIKNFTPFDPLQFESRTAQRTDFAVVVARGAFTIAPDSPLQMDDEQPPPLMTDEYRDQPGTSSIRVENSLAPYKPATDIHLDATAQVPRHLAAPAFKATVQLGKRHKQIAVTGERYWQHKTLSGWRLTDPEPCDQVPVRYELAYGGSYRKDDTLQCCPDNSVGTGFVDKKQLDKSKPIPAPRIMSLNDPVLELGKAYRPEGFGPLAPAWQNRARHAGTMDAAWEKTRWPELPADFNFAFYNSAHPELIYPGFVNGDEPVRLVNLSRIPELNFTLPGYALAVLVRYENGVMMPLPANLDTIHLQPDKMKAWLTWRAIFPLEAPVRVLEVHMTTKK